MKILMIGDIVGANGVEFVKTHLNAFKKINGIDFCVANGENAAGNGISRELADALINAGVNAITLGNHSFNRSDVYKLFDEGYPIVRPANYPPGTPGPGHLLFDAGDYTIAVINLMGRLSLECIDCPFREADNILKRVQSEANVILVDFHAEATSEKIAMGYYLDGRTSAVVGTHTHVQTADERVLPEGTAYITDIGMTGPSNSVIGVKKEIIVRKFLTHVYQRFEISDNPIFMNSVIIDIDADTGKALSIERMNID